jgi:hypothetical protein
MTFWDRFVLRLCVGLADTVPVGRGVAAGLFALAFGQGRLMPAFLNDLSLLLLLAGSSGGSPVHTAAAGEGARRGLPRQPRRLWELLQAIRPDRLTDLLELGRSGQPVWRSVLAQALLRSDVVSDLADFLGRLSLVEPDSRRNEAQRLVLQAAGLYYGIPQGTMTFPCRLYRHVLHELRQDQTALPSVLPPGPRPAWLTALDADEQMLIDRCLLWLSEPDVTLLYLHFYGRLDSEQMACVLNARKGTWTADQVARRLEQCWQTVLS